MRIALDGTAISAAPSGARTRMIHLLRAYFELPDRHEIVVFGTRESGLEAALSGAADEFVTVQSPGGPARRWLLGVDWRRRLDDVSADALSAETLPVPRDPGRPMLLTVHDLRGAEAPLRTPRRWYATWVLPGALKRVTRLIAVSNYTQDRLGELGVPADRVSVVGNAPDPSLAPVTDETALIALRDRLGIRGPVVLALGHLEPRKNLGVLIDALGGVVLSGRKPTLVLAGRDEVGEGASLAARAEQRGVDLVRSGPVTDEDRAGLLSMAACVVVPSLIEGFGIVPLEAWVAGAPVVCSNAGALPEVAGAVCPLIDPRDVDGFRAAISDLLADSSRSSDQVVRGRARVKSFTWKTAARALKDAHDRALEGH